MGYLELKPAASLSSKPATLQNGSAFNPSQGESAGGRTVAPAIQHSDSGNVNKDQISRTKPLDGRLERTESIPLGKSDQGHPKPKGGSSLTVSDSQTSLPSSSVQASMSKSTESQKQLDEFSHQMSDESTIKFASKSAENEVVPLSLSSLT